MNWRVDGLFPSSVGGRDRYLKGLLGANQTDTNDTICET